MKKAVDHCNVDRCAGVGVSTTHWSVVLKAYGVSPASQEALDKLWRLYWQLVYSFVRRQRNDITETKDLTRPQQSAVLQ